jgi:5-formyltetrahydrofolate cyclo-ligase
MPEPDGEVVGVGAAGLLALACRVVLLPGLAVSTAGIRLGQGGGFYDRLLADLPRHPAGPLRVAVVHEDEFLQPGELASEPHDLLGAVDQVLTPERVHLVAAPSTGD